MKKIVLLVACLLLAGAAWLVMHRSGSEAGAEESAEYRGQSPIAEADPAGGARGSKGTSSSGDESAEGAESGESEAEPEPTAEEKAAADEEKRVDAFDALTDKWMEASKDGVKMKDVDAFVAQFKSVPKDRQDECLHRALNLIPDENVMLLAGILMDKTIAKELVELVYNDVLNRDEEVKKPILQTIFKDKTHPCWADTAWILDVTGEQPKGESSKQ